MGLVIGSGWAGFAAFLALHILIWRWRPSPSPRVFALAALAGLASGGSLVFYSALRPLDFDAAVTLLLFDALIYAVYVNFYGVTCRSVSVTLLIRFLGAPRGVPLRDLVEEYERSSRFGDRLAVMEKMGWIERRGNDFLLTPKGNRVATFVRTVATVLSGRLEG